MGMAITRDGSPQQPVAGKSAYKDREDMTISRKFVRIGRGGQYRSTASG